MALCQIYDFGFHRVRSLGLRNTPAIGNAVAALFVVFAVVALTLFAPLTYGNPWTQDKCKAVKLVDTWDFDCNTFHTDASPPIHFSTTANM